MFGEANIQNSNVWKSQNSQCKCLKRKSGEFQCFADQKFRIPMFRKAKRHNSNVQKNPNSRIPVFRIAKICNSKVCKRQNSQFQCLDKRKLTIPMFLKAKNKEFQCLEWPKVTTAMFGKPKIHNSNIRISQSSQFQCLEKPKLTIPTFATIKSRIPMLWQAIIHNSIVWKSRNKKNSTVKNSENSQFQRLEKPKFTIPMFGNKKNQEIKCFE